MDKKLINFVKNAKLSKLGELFKVLAKKTTDYREKNNDSLPPKILPHALEICKNYVCMEVLPVLYKKGYALKLREHGSEQSWLGMYQIPGVPFTKNINGSFRQLENIIFGESETTLKLGRLEFIGVEIHFEPERNANCFTLVWCLKISQKDMEKFPGKWKLFSKNKINDETIIAHHRKTLGWVKNEKRQQFVDLR